MRNLVINGLGAFVSANLGIGIPYGIVSLTDPSFITFPLVITLPATCLIAFTIFIHNLLE